MPKNTKSKRKQKQRVLSIEEFLAVLETLSNSKLEKVLSKVEKRLKELDKKEEKSRSRSSKSSEG